jgi:hypothetical protein
LIFRARFDSVVVPIDDEESPIVGLLRIEAA